MSRSATPASRKEATRRLKSFKMTPFAEFTTRHGHTALTRTVANGCEGLQPAANINATWSEHTLNPHSGKREKISLPDCFGINNRYITKTHWSGPLCLLLKKQKQRPRNTAS